MTLTFSPDDTTPLGAALRGRPLSHGLLVVFSGGRRIDRTFAAWLVSGDIGLPLLHATMAIPGAAALVEPTPHGAGSGSLGAPTVGMPSSPGSPVHGSTAAPPIPGASGAQGRASSEAAAPTPPMMFGLGATTPVPGGALILSLDQPRSDLEAKADLVVRFPFPATGDVSGPIPGLAAGDGDAIDGCAHFSVAIGGRPFGFQRIALPDSVQEHPRGTRFGSLVLRRAITLDRELHRWRQRIALGVADIRPVLVTHLSASFEPRRNFWIEGAWPIRWSGPAFDAMDNAPAYEEIELFASRFEWR